MNLSAFLLSCDEPGTVRQLSLSVARLPAASGHLKR
jgi:hypothetical protein